MLPVIDVYDYPNPDIYYRKSFFDGSIHKLSMSQYVTLLQAFANEQGKQLMEWTNQTIRRLYFDIDVKHDSFSSLNMNFKELDAAILAECTRALSTILHCMPITIACASDEHDQATKGIVSYHLTFAFRAPVEMIRSVAARANQLLLQSDFGVISKQLRKPPFDETIYKATQGWRSINMSKPGCDRPMRLVTGTIEHSLIQNTEMCADYTCEIYMPPRVDVPQESRNENLAYISTGNAFMDFFAAALDRQELAAMWKSRACNTTEWLQVLQTLVFESQKKDGVLADTDIEVLNAKVLFQKFTLCGYTSLTTQCGSYDMMTQFATYMRQRGKLLIGFAQKIMGWVRSANDVVYKTLQNKKKKADKQNNTSIDFSFTFDNLDLSEIVPNADLTDGIQDLRCETRVRYIICGLFRITQLWPLLKHLFASKANLARLVSLFYCMDEEDAWIHNNIALFANSLRDLQTEEPLCPYDVSKPFELPLVQLINGYSFLDISEQDLLAYLRENPPMTTDFKVYEAFETSLKTYLYTFVARYHCETAETAILALDVIRSERSQRAVRILDKQDPWKRIISILESNCRWNYEKPYHYILEKEGIVDLWNKQPDKRIDLQLHICRLCNFLFAADIEWNMLTNVSTDKAAADVVYSMYPFFINTPAGFMMFDTHSGIWTMDELCWNRLIHKYSVLLMAKKGKDTWVRYGEDVAAVNKVTTAIKSVIPSTFVPFMEMKSSSLRRLLYNNGIYDGITMQFYPAQLIDGVYYFSNTTIMFFGKIDDDFNRDACDEELQDMKDALFYQIHGEEIGNYQIEKLACALLGEPFKGFFVNIGDPNSGKSTLKAMIESAFGSYIGTGTMDQLALIPNDSRDTGIANSILYHNWYKRLLLFSEKAGQRKLDTEKIKQYASGQKDKAVTRIQHKPDIVVDIHFVMSFYVNSDIEVDKPQDAGYVDRYNAFYSNKAFVPEEQLSDPTCQLIARPEVCEWQHSRKKRQLFNLIFIQAYEEMKQRGSALPMPKGLNMVSKSNTQTASVNMELMEQVLSQFIIDGQTTSSVPYTEIDKAINGDGKRFIIRFQHIVKSLGITTAVIESKKVYDAESKKYITKWIGVRARSSVEADGVFAVLKNFDEWKFLMKHYNGCIPKEVYAKLFLISQYKTMKLQYEDRNAGDYEIPEKMAIALNISMAIQTNCMEFDRKTLLEFKAFVEDGVSQLKATLVQSLGQKRKHEE